MNSLAYSKKALPLHSQNKGNGSLDEWLSQRSAKPCTAVRIRQEPPSIAKALNRNVQGFCRLLPHEVSRLSGYFGSADIWGWHPFLYA